MTNGLRGLRAAGMLLAAGAVLAAGSAWGQDDPYERYVKTSKDFQRVKQEKDWALKAWPSWTYMPWTYQWTLGYDDASGKWSLENGYNGAFLDHGQTRVGGVDKLAWINQFSLRFYMDHTAGKGDLYLKDRGGSKLPTTGLRSMPINEGMRKKLKDLISRNIGNLKSSPNRAAYALDDEISWGSFVKPAMWRITDEKGVYEAWLKEVYGADNAPAEPKWISYQQIWPKLSSWAVKDFDCSALIDQLTFNDSYWANFLGELVEHANSVDPATPCGFVGAQSPSAFGGFDYAKIMRKIQFIEAYNYGDSQAVIRSFNPHNGLPQVTTHFHKNVRDTVWQTWYYLAEGNRGMIGWVQGWFQGTDPKPWLAAVAPTYLEVEKKISPLLSGGEWIHDGAAIYYNHCSLQMNWILDAEAHGSTWKNRNTDATIGGGHLARKAWANMLRDEGVQFNFINYADVIRHGVPAEYKVLILPATIALSDAEARKIMEFCRNGGTVIADYLPGIFDQHGRGRAAGGALDEMFGVAQDPNLKAKDVFGPKLWVESNQDKHYSFKSYDEYLSDGGSIQDDSGFDKAVRETGVNHVHKYGKGTAVLMNLSPVYYNAYRVHGMKQAAKREVFMKHVRDGGATPWVRIDGAGEDVFGYEITYWKKGGRTFAFVVMNPETRATMVGGGNSVGLKTDTVKIALKFAAPVRGVRDERAGKDLGDGDRFAFDWTMNQAVVVSFEGDPPR